jgi:hypothetical protein
MLLAAFLYSASFFLFKAFALKAEFWATALWESVGFILFASFLLVFVPSYRSDFLAVFPRNRIATLLMMLNEMVNIAGKIVFNYFSISIPLALAWLGVSFQSVFVLLYGIILTKIFPNICQEGIAANQLRQKVLALLLMLIGACVIYTP